MKKRIYICLVLLVCLLLTSTGCSLNLSLQFGNDQSNAAEGAGAFPEDYPRKSAPNGIKP